MTENPVDSGFRSITDEDYSIRLQHEDEVFHSAEEDNNLIQIPVVNLEAGEDSVNASMEAYKTALEDVPSITMISEKSVDQIQKDTPIQKDEDGFDIPQPVIKKHAGSSVQVTSTSAASSSSKPPVSSNFPAANSAQRLLAPSLSKPATNSALASIRKKKPLKPGYSPLDWARISSSLVAPLQLYTSTHGSLRKITIDELKVKRNKENGYWLACEGKVYDVTRYMDFHPGGRGQLLRGVGKDATRLIRETHSWVNVEALLGKCLVGFLLPG